MKKYFLVDYHTGRHTSAALVSVRKSIPLRTPENNLKTTSIKVRKLFTNMFTKLLTFTNIYDTMASTGTERG